MSTDWQRRLLNYEVKPPADTWKAVAEALNETNPAFVQRLQNYEQAPDAECWSKLAEQLNAGKEAIPLYHRYSKLIKYVSAAAILIILAVSISLLFIPKHESEIAATRKLDAGTIEQNRNTFSDSDKNTFLNNRVESENRKKKDSETEYYSTAPKGLAAKVSSYNRYIAFTNNKGKTVKLSKKVMPVFNCADNAAASNSLRCKENIKSLQQKMATSTLPPTTDFAGLIDMIKHLEDN